MGNIENLPPEGQDTPETPQPAHVGNEVNRRLFLGRMGAVLAGIGLMSTPALADGPQKKNVKNISSRSRNVENSKNTLAPAVEELIAKYPDLQKALEKQGWKTVPHNFKSMGTGRQAPSIVQPDDFRLEEFVVSQDFEFANDGCRLVALQAAPSDTMEQVLEGMRVEVELETHNGEYVQLTEPKDYQAKLFVEGKTGNPQAMVEFPKIPNGKMARIRYFFRVIKGVYPEMDQPIDPGIGDLPRKALQEGNASGGEGECLLRANTTLAFLKARRANATVFECLLTGLGSDAVARTLNAGRRDPVAMPDSDTGTVKTRFNGKLKDDMSNDGSAIKSVKAEDVGVPHAGVLASGNDGTLMKLDPRRGGRGGALDELLVLNIGHPGRMKFFGEMTDLAGAGGSYVASAEGNVKSFRGAVMTKLPSPVASAEEQELLRLVAAARNQAAHAGQLNVNLRVAANERDGSIPENDQ